MTDTLDTDIGGARELATASLWTPLRDGEHSCWYPVALSDELAPGQLKGMDFCDGQVVVYRGEDRQAHVTTTYCPHMGANLSVGRVVGNDLQCAFHHWSFGADGRCSNIPSGDRIPGLANVFSFPVEEKWGMIWAFFGEEPLYPVPSFPGEEGDYEIRSFRIDLDEPLRTDPWVFGTNLFDFQHLQVLHELPGLNPEVIWHDTGGEWEGEWVHETIGKMTMSIRMWGVNSVVSRSTRGDEELLHIAAMTPQGKEGLMPYFCVAAPKGHPAAEAILDQQQALHTELVSEDLPIMNTMRMGQAIFSQSDRHMVRYIRWARQYPRTRMRDLEASARASR